MMAPALRRWSRDEYREAARMGILRPEERLELVDGQIVQKMTHNPPHFVTLGIVEDWLRSQLPTGVHLRSQGPIALNESSEPEPDIAVVFGGRQDYALAHPTPQQIELLIEVSDSSLDRDRRIRATLYGKAGIRELWIVDVNARKLEMHREPGPNGYRVVTILAETESAAPLFAPDKEVRVSDLLIPESL